MWKCEFKVLCKYCAYCYGFYTASPGLKGSILCLVRLASCVVLSNILPIWMHSLTLICNIGFTYLWIQTYCSFKKYNIGPFPWILIARQFIIAPSLHRGAVYYIKTTAQKHLWLKSYRYHCSFLKTALPVVFYSLHIHVCVLSVLLPSACTKYSFQSLHIVHNFLLSWHSST